MTAPLLLAYICAAIVFQIALGIAIAVWRRGGRVGGPVTLAETGYKPAGAWQGWREFRVSRREFEDEARTQCSFYLEPVDGGRLAPFKPGQFLTFTLPIEEGSPRPEVGQGAITRCYSLSDRPDSSSYRVTIKRAPAPAERPDLPPGVASNHFHDRVLEGAILKVRAPSGHFFIDPDPDISAALIAGGIGVTPMMSMLRWCLTEQPGRTIHLYYGVRNSREHAFKETLEQLAEVHPNFHLNVIYSRPEAEDAEGSDFKYAGHVDIDLLRRTLPQGRCQFYVCGPPAMMESLVPALGQWGVLPEDIRHEAFGPASIRSTDSPSADPASNLTGPVEVRFKRSGRTLSWDGEESNLLDFAERHGVRVDSGCRSGSCGTCETKIVSGAVLYPGAPDYDVAPGHCLLCVATPASPLVLEV